MIRRFSSVVLTLQFLFDLLVTVGAVKVAELARLSIVTGLERREQFVTVRPNVYLLVLGIWALGFLVFGVFDYRKRVTLASDLGSLWLSITVSMLILASLFYLLAVEQPAAPSRLFYLYFYVLDLAALSLVHTGVYLGFSLVRRRGRSVRNVLLVGSGVHGRHVAVRLRGREAAGLALVGYVANPEDPTIPNLPRLGGVDDVPRLVAEYRIDEAVIALPAEDHRHMLQLLTELEATEVRVRIMPDVFELVAMKARVEDFYGMPLISITEPSISPVQAGVKRLFDLTIASALLIPAAPLMAVVALLIKVDTPGPVIIHQWRVGARGMPFHMHKFRSMTWNPADLDAGFTKQVNDPRVTRVGHYLRRTSLDEIPQLWNVIMGEMSLVGPRPELPSIVEGYEPWQRKRFNVPPGMTGWWQVNGRSDHSMHLNTEVDLFYVQNYSILLDVQILLRTLGAVIRGKGAF